MQPSIFPSVLIVKRVWMFACLNTSRLCLSLFISGHSCTLTCIPVHTHPAPLCLPAFGTGVVFW